MTLARNLPPDAVGVYHIYNRSNNGGDIFLDEDDFLIFLNIIGNAKSKFGIEIFHYCILINHYHLLVRSTGAALSKAMKWVGFGYSRKHSAKYRRTGPLWQSRYKSEIIDTSAYLSICSEYVALNAVKHQIVANPADYKWSSYHYYASGERDDLITCMPEYYDLAPSASERRDEYTLKMKDRAAAMFNTNEKKIIIDCP